MCLAPQCISSFACVTPNPCAVRHASLVHRYFPGFFFPHGVLLGFASNYARIWRFEYRIMWTCIGFYLMCQFVFFTFLVASASVRVPPYDAQQCTLGSRGFSRRTGTEINRPWNWLDRLKNHFQSTLLTNLIQPSSQEWDALFSLYFSERSRKYGGAVLLPGKRIPQLIQRTHRNLKNPHLITRSGTN